MRITLCIHTIHFLFLLLSVFASAEDKKIDPIFAKNDIEEGAYLFRKNCTLCHGVGGMGEGPLALALSSNGYPDTNLMLNRKSEGYDAIYEAIEKGNKLDRISEFMPPWGLVFDEKELKQLASIVTFLRDNPKDATVVLRNQGNRILPSIRHGELMYNTYCVRCHGKEGLGDGKMSRIIKTPPPANLVKSGADDRYMELIITVGGEVMKRSAQMPPWGDELSRHDILSVIEYIKTMRK